MRIGFVTVESPFDTGRGGGIAAYLRAIIPCLLKDGHTVTVFANNTRPPSSFSEEEGRFRVYHLPLPGLHWYLSRVPLLKHSLTLAVRHIEWSVRFYREILHAGGKEQLDVLECSEVGGLFLGRIAPLVIRSHGSEYVFRKYMGRPINMSVRLNHILERRTWRQASAITTPSRFQAQEIASALGCSPESVHVISNPIAATVLNHALQHSPDDSDQRPPVILYTGRLAPVKGVEPLLKAVNLVKQECAQISFILAGSWQMPQPPAYWRFNDSTRSTDGIRWLGHVPWQELAEWYRRATVFIMPSYYETFCISVVEAMTFGLPVVATTAGGLPEVVEDGVTGILVPPGDPRALAEAIIRLLRDPELRRRMGQAGRERVLKEFTVECVIGKMLQVYHQAALIHRKSVNFRQEA